MNTREEIATAIADKIYTNYSLKIKATDVKEILDSIIDSYVHKDDGIIHNELSGLNEGDFKHLTAEQMEELVALILHKNDYEPTANKEGAVATYSTSTTKFPTIKGIVDWCTSIFQAKLFSGVNLRPINGNSLLGSANLQLQETTTSMQTLIDGSAVSPDPVDADQFMITNSSGTATRKISWSGIIATLFAYFETIYQRILVSGTTIKTVGGVSLLGSGNVPITLATVNGNILYVSTGGSDADSTRSGHLGDMMKPFLTLESAKTTSISGDLIYVFAGTYSVSITGTNGLSKDGINYYFETGCIINKSTIGDIFNSTGFSIGCNVFGTGDFNKTTTSGVIFNLLIGNSIFEFNKCTSTTDVCIQNISPYFLNTSGLSCISTGSASMWLGWGAGGHTLVNIPYIKSTAGPAIRCWGSDSAGSNYVINSSKVESTAGNGVHATCGTFNIAYCYGSSYGYQLGYYGGYVTINGYSNSIYMNTLTLQLNGRTAILNCVAGTVTGGMCDNLIVSGGNVQTTLGDYYPTLSVSGGVAVISLNAVGLNMNVTGGKVTLSENIKGNGTYALIYNTGQYVSGGRLDIAGALYFADMQEAFILSGAGVIGILSSGSINMVGTNRGYKNAGIRFQGGKILSKGGTITVADSNCLPIAVETANRDIKVFSSGFNTNSILGLLPAKKQKMKFTVSAVATTSFTINATSISESDTATYNTKPLLASRLSSLINASALNTVITATYTASNEYFEVEALVASTAYTFSALNNLVYLYVIENSYALSNQIGGEIIEDTDVE